MALVLVTLIAVTIAGCKESDQISQYTVPRAIPVVTSRMLSALVPYEDQAWFFKLSGPTAEIDPHAAAYDEFLQSVKFDGRGEPNWTLPAGWKQLPSPANSMQFATIEIGQSPAPPDGQSAAPADGQTAAPHNGQRLMLAVSKLPYLAERHQQYALININRWRGQMQLDPIAAVDLPDETRELKLSDATATVVDLRGNLKPDAMAPFAGKMAAADRAGSQANRDPSAGAPSNANTKSGPNSTTSGPSAGGTDTAGSNKPSDARSATASSTGMLPNLPLTFDVPKEWSPAELKVMRVAAYQVIAGDQRAEITIIPLGPASGELKPNIDRWRGEIGLPPTDSVEAARALVKQLEVDGKPAEFVDLVGTAESTLGAIVRRPDSVWFFKIRGAAELVAREKSRFEEFVRSVKFKNG